MQPTRITRPKFPKGYVDRHRAYLTWDWVAGRLTESRHYWLSSVRPPTPEFPGGRPHVVPRWAVFVDGKIYYDGSPETRHSFNIEANPYITVHLESGTEAVILEGIAREAGKPAPALANALSAAYKKKYAAVGYAPEPNSWDEGGLFVFTPRQCIAWSNFTEDPTKFVFDE